MYEINFLLFFYNYMIIIKDSVNIPIILKIISNHFITDLQDSINLLYFLIRAFELKFIQYLFCEMKEIWICKFIQLFFIYFLNFKLYHNGNIMQQNRSIPMKAMVMFRAPMPNVVGNWKQKHRVAGIQLMPDSGIIARLTKELAKNRDTRESKAIRVLKGPFSLDLTMSGIMEFIQMQTIQHIIAIILFEFKLRHFLFKLIIIR